MNVEQEILNAENVLLNLQKEFKKLQTQIPAIEAELKSATERYNSMRDGFHRDGLISQAKKEIEKAKQKRFPCLNPEADRFYVRHIVAVDSKFVTISGGWNGSERYRISDGCLERSRSGYSKIDIKKALALWNDWIIAHNADGTLKPHQEKVN